MERAILKSTLWIMLPVSVLAIVGGCTKKPARAPEVGPVTLYGLDLNESATPKQVAYALTRAMRDDYLAESPEDRNAAIDKQFELSASDLLRASNPLSIDDNEFLHEIVYRWTPTVAYYVHDFDLTWEEADAKYRAVDLAKPINVRGTSHASKVVLVPLTDPVAGPAGSVVLMIRLVQDGKFWRVYRLEFDRKHRTILNSANALADMVIDGGTAKTPDVSGRKGESD
ncbi:MAG: hypothetical protein ACPGXK_13775 [Phycisphaerae bacterium]